MMTAVAIVGWSLFSGAVVLFELDRLYLRKRISRLEDCIETCREENRRLYLKHRGRGMDLHQAALNLKEIERLDAKKRDRKGRFTG